MNFIRVDFTKNTSYRMVISLMKKYQYLGIDWKERIEQKVRVAVLLFTCVMICKCIGGEILKSMELNVS